jgi:hypothetical protein
MRANLYAITKAHRMRYCHYCSQPTPVAFYCQALVQQAASPTSSTSPTNSKWACPNCYINQYVPVHGGQHTSQELVRAAS